MAGFEDAQVGSKMFPAIDIQAVNHVWVGIDGDSLLRAQEANEPSVIFFIRN